MEHQITFKRIDALTTHEKSSIHELIDEYYSNSVELFKHLNKGNNWVYILTVSSKIIGFYMLGKFERNEKELIHLGQSIISKQYRGSRFANLLYEKQMADIKIEQYSKNRIIYATTANPSIFKYASFVYNNVAPKLDGSYSKEELKELQELQSILNIQGCPQHPFIIRNYASVSRIKETSQKSVEEVSVFKNYNLNESKGDRLIILLKP